MTDLIISGGLSDRLLHIAAREKRSVDDVLATLLDRYAVSDEIDAVIKFEPKTGAEIVAMLAQMEPIEFLDPEIEDPVEWVSVQRRKDAERLKPYWNGQE